MHGIFSNEDTMEFNINLPGISEAEHRAVQLDPSTIYDVLIIGGGPSALTAAVYCMRKGVTTGLLTADIGGQVAETATVENYMGYMHIEGIQLVEKFHEQVQQFEMGLVQGARATSIEYGNIKKVTCDDGNTYQAKTLILSTGNSWKTLNVPGEKELKGKGVAYCAICDAPLFAQKDVVVVGGGNTGVEAAIDLAKSASSVTLVQFLDHLTADRILVGTLNRYANVSILYSHQVTGINGQQQVEAVTVQDRETGKTADVTAQGIFIEIGLKPNTDPFNGVVELNQYGEVIIDCNCRTSRPGIFAAGDVTSVPYKQIIIAAGEGAKAALSACEFVLKQQE